MNFKEHIESLLLKLKMLKIDRRQIEKDLDYKENYIDQIISKGGNQKFLNRLKAYYELKKDDDDDNNLSDAQANYIKAINIDAGKTMGRMIEIMIYNTADINVLKEIVDKMVSDHTGQSIALVSGQRKKAVQMEADRLFDEERRKLKQG